MNDHETVRYVLGFVFSVDRKRVVLLRKNRGPAGMTGKLNGIGGHVKHGESFDDAMWREAGEEIGVTAAWRRFCTMRGAAWVCVCYETTESELETLPAKTDVDEDVLVVSCEEAIRRDDVMLNLKWLIPMALEGPLVGDVDYRLAKRGDR